MEHFYQNIDGWFTDSDAEFYKQIVNFLPDEAKIVEVGSWKGRSTSCMAVEIINSNKNITFFCVDTWKGSEELLSDKDVINDTLYDVFWNNIFPVVNFVKPLILDSVSASKIFGDETLDFVFIDGAHDFDSVKADIEAWFPKVKQGGVIGGHDHNHEPVQQAIKETINKEYFVHNNCWAYKKV